MNPFSLAAISRDDQIVACSRIPHQVREDEPAFAIAERRPPRTRIEGLHLRTRQSGFAGKGGESWLDAAPSADLHLSLDYGLVDEVAKSSRPRGAEYGREDDQRADKGEPPVFLKERHRD